MRRHFSLQRLAIVVAWAALSPQCALLCGKLDRSFARGHGFRCRGRRSRFRLAGGIGRAIAPAPWPKTRWRSKPARDQSAASEGCRRNGNRPKQRLQPAKALQPCPQLRSTAGRTQPWTTASFRESGCYDGSASCSTALPIDQPSRCQSTKRRDALASRRGRASGVSGACPILKLGHAPIFCACCLLATPPARPPAAAARSAAILA